MPASSAEQQAAAACDREAELALSALAGPPPPDSDAAGVLQHHRKVQALQALWGFYRPKLPVRLLVPRLLAAGSTLAQRAQHALAAHAFQFAADLAGAGDADATRTLVPALYGLHCARAAAALDADARLQHEQSVAALRAAVDGLQAATSLASSHSSEPAADLVRAGTEHLQRLCERLIAAGRHADALPALVFAARAMEGAASLGAAQHLPWRAQLYTAAATCFHAAAAHDEHRAFLDSGLAALEALRRAQALDAVPDPDAAAALRAARARLSLLQAVLLPGLQPADVTGLRALLAPLGSAREQLQALADALRASLSSGAAASPLDARQPPEQLQAPLAVAADLAGSVLAAGAPAAEPGLHLELLCVACAYQQQELCDRLIAAAVEAGAAGTASGPHAALVAAARVLQATLALQRAPSAGSALLLAATLAGQDGAALGERLPGLLAAAALRLHEAAGWSSAVDDPTAPALQVLEGLHTALTLSRHPDGVLHGCIALRLARAHERSGQLDRALAVLGEGLAAIVGARAAELTATAGRADERVRWISGARTQADDAAAAALANMPALAQELACLHADALLARARVELALGLRRATARAASRQQALLASIAARDEHDAVFGARTRKERRADAAAVDAAGQPPATAPDCEHALLAACGASGGARALVLVATALAQPDPDRQAALLEGACDDLDAAQAAEAALFAAAVARPSPQRPTAAILGRLPHSVTLTAELPPAPAASSGARAPALCAAFCKPHGAATLAINKTACECPGEPRVCARGGPWCRRRGCVGGVPCATSPPPPRRVQARAPRCPSGRASP